MKLQFMNPELEEIYRTGKSKKYDSRVMKSFARKVSIMERADNIDVLYAIRGLNCEMLKGHRSGEMSIRLNRQRRVIFRHIEEGGIEIIQITELSNHYS